MVQPAAFHACRSGRQRLGTHVAGRPFKIAAKTWNEEAREHGLLLEWTDPRACPCEYILPRGEIDAPNPPWRKALGNLGLALAPGRRAANLLAAYLTRAQHETSVDLVRRTGWYGPDPDFSAFVLPDATIGPPLAEAVRFDGGALPGPKLARKGTLDGWKEGVARPAIGNSRLGLAILVALAAPLLRIVGQESAGLHLRGGSSVGKTTALRVAASVWGAELFNWRTTDNGLEATATSHNDLLLALDEIGQAEPKVMAAVAYMLANGRGKSRMSTDRVAIQSTTWRLLFLSTGETSLGEMIKPGGGQVMAGQEVRFLDLPADAGQNLGLFDRLPEECPSAAAFAEQIRTATESETGSAGRAFVQWLMEQGNLTSLKTRLQREIEAWCADHIPRNADGQAIRAGRRFALLSAAGKLATEAGILPWPVDEAEFATVRCWGDWIANRGGFGSGEVRIVLERLKSFIDAHGASRFQELGEDRPLLPEDDLKARREKIQDRAGYVRRSPNGEMTYLFTTSSWKNEIVKGLDVKTINKALLEIRVLWPDSEGKSSRLDKIGGIPVRTYHVSAEQLELASATYHPSETLQGS